MKVIRSKYKCNLRIESDRAINYNVAIELMNKVLEIIKDYMEEMNFVFVVESDTNVILYSKDIGEDIDYNIWKDNILSIFIDNKELETIRYHINYSMTYDLGFDRCDNYIITKDNIEE